MEDQYKLRDKKGKFIILIEHCSGCNDHYLQKHPDMDEDSINQMILDFREMLEISSENDLIRREIEEENKYLKDLKSDETRPSNMPEIKLKKYEYKILRNKELPREFYQYDKVQVPDKKFPKKVQTLLFDKRNGEFTSFPRQNSFEIYFNNDIVFSRLQSNELLDADKIAKQIIEITHGLCEPSQTPFKLQSPQKILHRRAHSQAKSNIQLPYSKGAQSQNGQDPSDQLRFKSFQSIVKVNKGDSPQSPDIQSLKAAQQNPFSPKKYPGNYGSYFSYHQSNQKIPSIGGQSPIEQFYGLPQVKQLAFRKSLERFNHVVNYENDTKFKQLITHRRQYNKYIQMMASAKASQERKKQEIASKFEEKIKERLKDFQLSKSRLDTKESGVSDGNKSPPPSSKRVLNFRKKRQNSVLSNYLMRQKEYKEVQSQLLRNTFSGEFTTQDQSQTKQQVKIDRAYQLSIMIGRPCYKKINLINTLHDTKIFRFQSSHPKEVEILDDERRQCVVELQSGQKFKPLVRFHKQDREGQKQYVIFVYANGERYQNILLNVEFKEISEFQP